MLLVKSIDTGVLKKMAVVMASRTQHGEIVHGTIPTVGIDVVDVKNDLRLVPSAVHAPSTVQGECLPTVRSGRTARTINNSLSCKNSLTVGDVIRVSLLTALLPTASITNGALLGNTLMAYVARSFMTLSGHGSPPSEFPTPKYTTI